MSLQSFLDQCDRWPNDEGALGKVFSLLRSVRFDEKLPEETIEMLVKIKDQLILWSIRHQQSPDVVEVEATVGLLVALIGKNRSDKLDQATSLTHQSQLAMAIIKFTDVLSFYQATHHQNREVLYRTKERSERGIKVAARKLGIPQWIIQCRHDASHTITPSTQLLERAIVIALDWLMMYFWKQLHEQSMSNDGQKKQEINGLISSFQTAPKDHSSAIRETIRSNSNQAIKLIVEAMLKASAANPTIVDGQAEPPASRTAGTEHSSPAKDHTYLLIKQVATTGHLHRLLRALVHRLDSRITTEQHHAGLWLIKITKAIHAPSKDGLSMALQRKESYEKNGHRAAWLNLFHEILKRPNHPLSIELVREFELILPWLNVEKPKALLLQNERFIHVDNINVSNNVHHEQTLTIKNSNGAGIAKLISNSAISNDHGDTSNSILSKPRLPNGNVALNIHNADTGLANCNYNQPQPMDDVKTVGDLMSVLEASSNTN